MPKKALMVAIRRQAKIPFFRMGMASRKVIPAFSASRICERIGIDFRISIMS
jgi:hypothetical protein